MFTAVDEELDFILKLLQDNYEIKNRGRLGGGPKDVQDIVILGRIVKLHSWGLTWQADPRHREMILEHFGMDERTKSLSKNGYKEEVPNEGEQEEELQADEAREFRGLAARQIIWPRTIRAYSTRQRIFAGAWRSRRRAISGSSSG